MRKGFDHKKKKDKSHRNRNYAVRVSSHPWVKCESGKMGYRTWIEADLAATAARMYFYQCRKCPEYHLTEVKQKKPPR